MPSSKPIEDRVRECVQLWKKLTVDLLIPGDISGMPQIKERIDAYVKHGDAWSGVIPLPSIGRSAHCFFPQGAFRECTIMLKHRA